MTFELKVCGAAGEVTGSCHLVKFGQYQVLLDCGLIQGNPKSELRNQLPFPFDPKQIDAVILSHAHIDHSGRLPLLVARGFRGPIYCQAACRDLCDIMLQDSAYLQEKESEWRSRKLLRKGLEPIAPLYTRREAIECMMQFKPIEYDQDYPILPGCSVRLSDAGHMLGGAIVELSCEHNGQTKKLVYSGDLGHNGSPILRDVASVKSADLVLMESTYGDRFHRSWQDTMAEMQSIFKQASKRRGNIIIPAFSVGRCQELLYFFARFYKEWHLSKWHIFVDSPMATKATQVYDAYGKLFDREAKALLSGKPISKLLPNLSFTPSAADSMSLNRISKGAIIIAGSGMCTGGRVKHHLKHLVWRKNTTLVIVGYQAEGTTGRRLVDGAKFIRLWGETIRVAAKVYTIGGLSSHADQTGLLDWYQNFNSRPPVVLVHGEPKAQVALKYELEAETSAKVQIAEPLQVIKF